MSANKTADNNNEPEVALVDIYLTLFILTS